MIVFRKITVEQVEEQQFAIVAKDCRCSADNYASCMCLREDGC